MDNTIILWSIPIVIVEGSLEVGRAVERRCVMGQLSQGQNREVNCDVCEAELCHRFTALMRIALQKSASWMT